MNPNCDHQTGICSEDPEVRILPLSKQSNLHCCKKHFESEIAWRKEVNQNLGKAQKFNIPNWEDLPIKEN